MRFVKTDDLEKGMRLARPVYNKNGVLLYDRDTKLTRQGINSIRNFSLIGIYILEPTEPLPPMTEEDIEFERFQTMSVFGLREDMALVNMGKTPANIENMAKLIIKKYANKDIKLSTIQNLRSSEDRIYKHSLSIAILAAAMGARLKMTPGQIEAMVTAGLIFSIDISLLIDNEAVSEEVKMILSYEYRLKNDIVIFDEDERIMNQAKVLLCADIYDDMTAMQIGYEPESEVAAVKYFLANIEKYGDVNVGALVDSLRMLYPGICVQLTNKATGIVILGNEENVLRPIVLGFGVNAVYNLMDDAVYSKVQIEDIMKTMDKRVHIDQNTIKEYMERYSTK